MPTPIFLGGNDYMFFNQCNKSNELCNKKIKSALENSKTYTMRPINNKKNIQSYLISLLIILIIISVCILIFIFLELTNNSLYKIDS